MLHDFLCNGLVSTGETLATKERRMQGKVYLAVGRVLHGPSHVAALHALDADNALVNSLHTPKAACAMHTMNYVKHGNGNGQLSATCS